MTTADFELIHQRVKSHLGRVTTRQLGRVGALAFQRFAVASGETSGRYFSDDGARLEGFVRAVAPPLFLSSVMGWEAGPEEEGLRADGLGPTETEALPLEGLRIMGAGQDLEFLHPVEDGADVTEEISVADVQLKHGRSGPFLIYRVLRRFYDLEGRELLRCSETFIAR